ncbi:MAG: PstS family phosphate ABC transporter substrate-binding protein [Pseudomonadota bacterium]
MFLWFIAAVAQAQLHNELELEGKLTITGSDTLGAITSVWAEMLKERHPKVLVQVRAIGSAAAPTALVEGTADLGTMSRPMSAAEDRSFERRYGYAPIAVPVARDAIAVFVHRDNPLSSIVVPTLDAVFSSTRRCGHPQAVARWSDLGLSGPWASRGISLYGRSAASGTYSVFRQQVLCSGDFSPRVNRLVGSSAIIRAVAGDRNAIGYASAGYLNANVKALTVIGPGGQPQASLDRELYVYLNVAPGAPVSPLTAAFINLILSPEGQQETAKAGYLPLSMAEQRAQRRRLGLMDG